MASDDQLRMRAVVQRDDLLFPEIVDRISRALNSALFGEELKVWRWALALHNDWDRRSHLWHLPEIVPSPITTTMTAPTEDSLRTNNITIIAERDAPTVFCRRKEPWPTVIIEHHWGTT